MKTTAHFLTRFMNIFALSVLVLMMMLTAADVILRYVFNLPIIGTLELTEYMMLIIFYFGLAWCHLNKRNVRIDLLTKQFSKRIQALFDCIAGLFAFCVFSLVTWQGIVGVGEVWEFHKTSDLLLIPAYPFHLVLTLGAGAFCLVLLIDLIDSFSEVMKK